MSIKKIDCYRVTRTGEQLTYHRWFLSKSAAEELAEAWEQCGYKTEVARDTVSEYYVEDYQPCGA